MIESRPDTRNMVMDPRDGSGNGSCPRVGIVVLNWNSAPDTLDCLASLESLDYPNYFVVVVDNKSTDDSERRIRDAYPHVTFVQSGANLGYAGGNNVGIRYALDRKAAFVLILNPDVVLPPCTVTTLVQVATTHARVGALAPVVRYKDAPEDVWSGGNSIDWRAGTAYHETRAPVDGDIHQSAWASGCCLMLNAGALQAVGLFCAEYFLYFEEADLCQRLSRAGYTVGVCTRASVYHQTRVREAVKTNAPFYIYYTTRNAFLFFSRHAPAHHVRCGRIVWTLYRRNLFNRTALWHLRRREPKARARWRACVDFALGRFGASRVYR